MAVIAGTAGNDTFFGTSSADSITGSAGNDSIEGLGGADTAHGGSGDDTLRGGGGNDLLRGNGGLDVLNGGLGVDNLGGGADADIFAFSDFGAANADTIADFVSGEDVIQLDGEVFTGIGSSGFFAANASGTAQDADDRIIFETDTRQVWYDADGSGAGTRQLIATLQVGATLAATDIRVLGGTTSGSTINGTEGNDTLAGTAGNDTINGRGGDDWIDGGDGDDHIDGALGSDTLIGGLGADTFAFSVSPEATTNDPPDYDRIFSFASGTDAIELDGAAFAALGEGGAFSANDPRFHVGWEGIDGQVRVIYDPSTGFLFHDFDGSGTGNARIFAHLVNAPALTGADFTVSNEQVGPRTINGTAADDRMPGESGNDTINGFAGYDSLWGSSGDDVLNGGDGWDLLDGGDGSDTLSGGAGQGFFHGGAGNDLLIGGADHDEFYPGAGNDRVEGGDGTNTVFIGGPGFGGGPDFGADTLIGGAGQDQLLFTISSSVIADVRTGRIVGGDPSGGGSIDFSGYEYFGFLGNASVRFIADDSGVAAGGGDGDDTMTGGAGDDTLSGGDGENILRGGLGADLYIKNPGVGELIIVFDSAPGPGNVDTVSQFASEEDTLQFDGSVFTALGPSGRFAAGDARFYSAFGATQGHDADDRLVYNSSNGDLWYDADGSGAGASVLVAHLPQESGNGSTWIVVATDIEVTNGTAPSDPIIDGTAGDDSLSGTAASETINGLAGNDTIVGGGGGGDDTIHGGDGRDSIEFKSAAPSALVVDWVAGTITSSSGDIVFTSIERVAGGNFADSMSGTAGGQNLTGQGGSDTLWGGNGADTLWGNSGGDFFVFREMGAANADRISDFVSGADEIQLDDAAFTALGPLGSFVAGDARFWSSTSGTAHDADDRVLYNTETGQLYYDADGNGAGAAQLIATVVNDPTLAATDITVI